MTEIHPFEKKFGSDAFWLLCHAAFPLALTSDLLYCLRENFVPECHWYHVADILLSGWCDVLRYDLYEMDPKTRDDLLRYLDQKDPSRLKDLEAFMKAYINHRLADQGSERITMVAGKDPEWTTLSALKPDEAVEKIREELQKLVESDPEERLQWAYVVDAYQNYLAQKGFKILIEQDWASRVAEGQEIPLREVEIEVITVDDDGQKQKPEKVTVYSFIERLDPNLALEMMAIPGGSFMMGSPPDEPKRSEDESPQHEVTLDPFFMSKYLITQAQWRFVAALEKGDLKLDPSYFGDPNNLNYPVERVSWEDAQIFCQRAF